MSRFIWMVSAHSAFMSIECVCKKDLRVGDYVETILEIISIFFPPLLTLPSFWAEAREALIVFRLLTHSSVFAGFATTWGHYAFTVFSCNTKT